jgi:MAP/microtubule affinity-regulating kinase
MTGRIEDYLVGDIVGRGSFAAVKIGTHKHSKQRVAIKTYDKLRLRDPQSKQGVKREMQILKRLEHPNIIRLHETLEDKRQIHIVTEYVSGLSLHSYLMTQADHCVDESSGKRLFRQVVEAIEYCHRLNVAHRDIKLENILLDESENVKVIDFGFSAVLSAECRTRTFCGTPNYMAPEIIMRKDYQVQPVDIWALGVLLYAILIGSFPFKGNNNSELFKSICKGDLPFPPSISACARGLIRCMLVLDPKLRPTCAQILSHPWVTQAHPDDTAALEALMSYGYSEAEIRSPCSVVNTLFERLKTAMTEGLC